VISSSIRLSLKGHVAEKGRWTRLSCCQKRDSTRMRECQVMLVVRLARRPASRKGKEGTRRDCGEVAPKLGRSEAHQDRQEGVEQSFAFFGTVVNQKGRNEETTIPRAYRSTESDTVSH
jgi:hypothetical protein